MHAGYAVTADSAACQCSAAVDTRIAQHVCVAFRVSERNKIQFHNLNSLWLFVSNFVAQGDRIPEIDIHVTDS